MSADVEPAGDVTDASFFKSLVENGSDAIISIDEDSEILFANSSVERVFGYEPHELVGEPLTVVMPERFQDAHHAAVADYLQTGERGLDWNDIELPGEHRDGHEVQLSITFEEHHVNGQRVFSGIMRDITDRVERERKLERQNEQLQRFASILSHDLRDPLNTARAELALAESELDDHSDHLDELADVHDRMEALVEDVLTLAKEGQTVGETDTVSVAAVARESWRAVGSEAGTLDVDAPGDVEADRERLQSLLENLLGNAVHHAGDDVTVTVGSLDGGGFYVADDGPGIPESEREDVFDYGYTNSDDGTGFGLNIVESIADAHGWSVAVADSESGGARFEFTGVRGGEAE